MERGCHSAAAANAASKAQPFFPSGDPFIYWDQYRTLKTDLVKWVAIEFVVGFFVCWGVLWMQADKAWGRTHNICSTLWASTINLCVCMAIVVEFYGFLAWTGVKLSAIPATSIWMSVGFAFEFTSHILVAFMCSTTRRSTGTGGRLGEALRRMLTPTLHGAISTCLGLLPLFGSNFEFVRKYYLAPYLILVAFSLANSCFVLPVLLGLVGPPTIKKRHDDVVPHHEVQNQLDQIHAKHEASIRKHT